MAVLTVFPSKLSCESLFLNDEFCRLIIRVDLITDGASAACTDHATNHKPDIKYVIAGAAAEVSE